MKYFIIISFLFTTGLFAQFTNNDRQLAATTFTRNFDKVTSKEYLTSKDDKKVIAGLLSVSHSEDTAFVHFIIDLPVDKFGREICFALGQLGNCTASTNYLINLLYKNNDPLIKYYALIAIGKTADSSFAKTLISDYDKSANKSTFNGISVALYYLFSNGKVSAGNARPVLEKELNFSSSRQFEAAFSLYRIGPDADDKDLLVNTLQKILNGRVISDVTGKPVPYLLACLCKLEYFPYDYNLLVRLKTLNDFESQVEAVKASAYYNYQTNDEFDVFLGYLNNDNNNITREAASSLVNIKLKPELRDHLYKVLDEYLQDNKKGDKYTRGELYTAYLSIYNPDFEDAYLAYLKYNISDDYLYKICSLYPDSKGALGILNEKFYLEDLKEKIVILESILNFKQTNSQAENIFFSALNSNEPGLISIAADGADSSFIAVNNDSLKKIIDLQINNNLNKADFIESLMSMYNLAGRISKDYQMQILDILQGSDLYSIRKFSAEKQGKTIRSISKDVDNFDTYWDYAFKYNRAEIVTEKGSFVISLLPEYAPVSAGNFCYLAEKGFYNGIPFHRVVPGFVIQGGDPTGTGWGGPGYEIISEFSPLEYSKGMVGMASAGKDTEGSQWFVTTGDYPHLNGKYTIFAEVLNGLDVVERITQDDKILKINLIR